MYSMIVYIQYMNMMSSWFTAAAKASINVATTLAKCAAALSV